MRVYVKINRMETRWVAQARSDWGWDCPSIAIGATAWDAVGKAIASLLSYPKPDDDVN